MGAHVDAHWGVCGEKGVGAAAPSRRDVMGDVGPRDTGSQRDAFEGSRGKLC